jgi:hypothetical protein
MARSPIRGPSADYDKSVFINCPFDDTCLPLFRALIFAVFECGLMPRCAQEVYDAGEMPKRRSLVSRKPHSMLQRLP